MTTSVTSTDNTARINQNDADVLDINEQTVSEYLQQTPDFFKRHPQLLAELSLPHNNSGATSLVERQVAVLRERSIKTRHRLSELIDIANDNEALFNKTQAFVIAVLQAPTLAEAFSITRQQLSREFDVQISGIGILSADSTYWQPKLPDDMLYAIDAAGNSIAGIIDSTTTFCGALRDSEAAYLFSHNQACSAAVATRPIQITGRDNLDRLIIGVAHPEPNHYDQQTGTVFIDYIADILQTICQRAGG